MIQQQLTECQSEAYLSFTVRPEVDSQPNHVVDGRVRALIYHHCGEGGQWEESKARFEAAVDA